MSKVAELSKRFEGGKSGAGASSSSASSSPSNTGVLNLSTASSSSSSTSTTPKPSPTATSNSGGATTKFSFASTGARPAVSPSQKAVDESVLFDTKKDGVIAKPVLPANALNEMKERISPAKAPSPSSNAAASNNNNAANPAGALPKRPENNSNAALLAKKMSTDSTPSVVPPVIPKRSSSTSSLTSISSSATTTTPKPPPATTTTTTATKETPKQRETQQEERPKLLPIDTNLSPTAQSAPSSTGDSGSARKQTPSASSSSSLSTTPLAAAAKAVLTSPPTPEEQDAIALFLLSHVVPFFALRLVFELVRRFVLAPARFAVRHAPGGVRVLTLIWVWLSPAIRTVLGMMPSMERVNAAARAGVDMWVQSVRTGWDKAQPHLVTLVNSVQNMKFRDAAYEAVAVMKASAPVLKALPPLLKQFAVTCYEGLVVFWGFSRRAVLFPFGGIIQWIVKNLGRSLSENPEYHAERVATILGPIVVVQVSAFLVLVLGYQLGLVSIDTLGSLYIAWIFRLFGLVDETSETFDEGRVSGEAFTSTAPTSGGWLW